jgi:endonuclease III
MKNSREHAQRLRKLYRGWKRAYPRVERLTYEDPAEALIFGILSERLQETAAHKALREIKNAFVDWNDLRVSRVEEVAEAIGQGTAAARATAFALTSVLRGIFDEYHKISLQILRKLGKRPARQGIEKLAGASRFAVNYCMLTSLDAHAMPLTSRMIDYLKSHEIIEPGASEDEIEGFISRQVAAKDAYEFYVLLRRESESAKAARRAKGPALPRGARTGRRRK